MGYVTNGGDLSALEAVNQVRARAGVDMPPLTSLNETKLRNERRIELAFEGIDSGMSVAGKSLKRPRISR